MATNFCLKYWQRVLLCIRIVGLVLMILAVLMNPIVVAKFIGKVGAFSWPTIKFIYKVEIIFLIGGICILVLERFLLRRCSSKIKEVTFKIIIFGCSVIIFLLLFELAIRVLVPQRTLSELRSASPAIFEKGEYISWQFKPNSTGRMSTGEFDVLYNINAFGLRDKHRNLTKAENITRILVLGDSFTEGYSVKQNETYSFFLEQILNNGSNTFEIWNGGVSGYSQDTEYVYLKNNIGKIMPNIVLLGFYVGNDIIDLCQNSWETDKNGLPKKVASKIARIQDNILRLEPSENNPYLSHFMFYLNLVLLRTHSYVWIRNKVSGAGNGDFEGVPMMIKDGAPFIKMNWVKTRKLFDAINNLSVLNNASLAVVIIPPRMQVYDKEWKLAENYARGYTLERDLPQKVILEWCMSKNITCINLLSEFQALNEPLYNTLMDSHLNKQGHLRTAQIVSKFLE